MTDTDPMTPSTPRCLLAVLAAAATVFLLSRAAGHEQMGTFVGALTLAFAVWTQVADRRPSARKAAWIALAMVAVIGVVGAISASTRVPSALLVIQTLLSHLFLCLLVGLAYATSHEWATAREPRVDATGVRKAASATAGMVLVQILLGTSMRHMEASMAIPDFPTVFGGIWPPGWTSDIAIHYAHRLGALIVVAKLIRLAVKGTRSGDGRLRTPTLALALLGLVQLGLGGMVVLSGVSPHARVTHAVVGALLLAGNVFVTLRARRLFAPPA